MSIRHIVFFTLKPGVDAHDPRVQQAMAISRGHGEHIEEIQRWWAGPDVSRREVSCDFAVMGLFDEGYSGGEFR